MPDGDNDRIYGDWPERPEMKEPGVDVGVRLVNESDWANINSILDFFPNSVSAGTGFGMRDMQFETKTEDEAIKLAADIHASLIHGGFINQIEYCNVVDWADGSED